MVALESVVLDEIDLAANKSEPQIGNKNQHGNRKFDVEKVARIKAQIARGEYQIDPARIVTKMIESKT